jgi:hypothetical protein
MYERLPPSCYHGSGGCEHGMKFCREIGTYHEFCVYHENERLKAQVKDLSGIKAAYKSYYEIVHAALALEGRLIDHEDELTPDVEDALAVLREKLSYNAALNLTHRMEKFGSLDAAMDSFDPPDEKQDQEVDAITAKIRALAGSKDLSEQQKTWLGMADYYTVMVKKAKKCASEKQEPT